MGQFRDHPTKKIIREKWGKPILHHINKNLGYKLIYLGLPGIEALDVLSWIQYLGKIIAFQCRDYPKPSHPSQSKKDVEKLDSILRDLERKGIIRSYSLYDGWIEEVVLSGMDTNGNLFTQNEIVHVYNLDFCNSLTVPLKIVDKNQKVMKYYKLEVIRKLLEIQRDLVGQKKFIMFLTVHSQFWEDEAEKLLKQVGSQTLNSYKKEISKLKPEDRNIRLLKLYVFNVLKTHFCSCNFSPEFLPPIYYGGVGNNWLMHFTIIGTYYKDPSASAPFFQDADLFLKNKFLFANQKNILCLDNKNIEESEVSTDPIKLFSETHTYINLWRKKRT